MSENSKIEKLERTLHHKQLQMNRLRNITHAINQNVPSAQLFEKYRSYLMTEMDINKMALYIKEDNQWFCKTHTGIELPDGKDFNIQNSLSPYINITNIPENHPSSFLRLFEIIIPVHHKEEAIAYALVGKLGTEEDRHDKIQYITTITNIVTVAIENKRLFKKQLIQERLNREMELAREMQQMLIPYTLPSNEHYELASHYKPYQSIGGDYFDFVELEDKRLIFCIADIAGKGVAAALLMANFQANFHSILKRQEDLKGFIQDLNDSLFRITQGEKHLTFFIGLYDPSQHLITYCNAGHHPPLLFSTQQLLSLEEGCTILGSFKKIPDIKIGKIKLEEDTILLTYTDGLTDTKNDKNHYFSEEKLRAFVKNKSSLSAPKLNHQILETLEQFKGKQHYPDDFTLLTCKFFV